MSGTQKQRAEQNRRYRATERGKAVKRAVQTRYYKRLVAAKKLAQVKP